MLAALGLWGKFVDVYPVEGIGRGEWVSSRNSIISATSAADMVRCALFRPKVDVDINIRISPCTQRLSFALIPFCSLL